ncbi:phosphohydrolase [Candidatus Roizmanbacteria bacterium CG01_land_8_20_14_3_00_33_9]|uniref:Phosphohydrolase n=1 Tax=Candidatus Roizmanbacteria bacterium CG01_land_8_20_14_3_00_33_9 TaxID=1974843 RepID=A0A2M7E5L6_9BACT|nr:MAG: phosphohydrolase [Candidatus Roizmanbacteria bacterium CG01_land_8_20_14_3_00_33_9]
MNSRQKYLDAVKSQLEPNIFKHSICVEACMGALYDYFQSQNLLGSSEPKRDEWTLAGLIHDIDYSQEFKPTHPEKTKKVLSKYNLTISDTVEHIVKAHAPDLTGVEPTTKADWSIFCCDSLTGLIVAVALVYPSKKLTDVKLSSVIKRFLKEPKFAAGTRRADVALCSQSDGLNLPLEKFIEISLRAMQKIAPEINL